MSCQGSNKVLQCCLNAYRFGKAAITVYRPLCIFRSPGPATTLSLQQWLQILQWYLFQKILLDASRSIFPFLDGLSLLPGCFIYSAWKKERKSWQCLLVSSLPQMTVGGKVVANLMTNLIYWWCPVPTDFAICLSLMYYIQGLRLWFYISLIQSKSKVLICPGRNFKPTTHLLCISTNAEETVVRFRELMSLKIQKCSQTAPWGNRCSCNSSTACASKWEYTFLSN